MIMMVMVIIIMLNIIIMMIMIIVIIMHANLNSQHHDHDHDNQDEYDYHDVKIPLSAQNFSDFHQMTMMMNTVVILVIIMTLRMIMLKCVILGLSGKKQKRGIISEQKNANIFKIFKSLFCTRNTQ